MFKLPSWSQTLPANKNQTNAWIEQNYWKLTFYLRIVWAQKALVHVFNIYVGRFLCGSACFSSFFLSFAAFSYITWKWKLNQIISFLEFFPSNHNPIFFAKEWFFKISSWYENLEFDYSLIHYCVLGISI